MFHKWQVGKRLFCDPQMHQNRSASIDCIERKNSMCFALVVEALR